MRKARWIIILLILLVSCKKQQEYDYPLIFTGQVTNITSSGVTFSAKITDLSKYKVTDYGFVWDEKPDPTIETSEKYIISDPPKIGVFSTNITTTLRSGVLYYVRAFVRNSDYITYGKQVSFKSLGSMAPKVADFKPKTGNLKDTVMIIGHNFSFKPTSNTVKFGDFQATVVKATLDTLWVLVPDKLNIQNAQVSVSIIGNIAIATDKYNLIAPVVTTFNDKSGSFGSQITITGKNFLSSPSSLHVYFDNAEGKIIDIKDQSIVVTVADSLNKRQCNINVKMNNITVSSTDLFTLKTFTINDFSPKIATTGSNITLTGNNFSPITTNNIVSVGGINANVTKATYNKLEIQLPLQNASYYSSRNAMITVNVIGDNKVYSDALIINDKWFRLHDAPVAINDQPYSHDYSNYNCMVSKSKAYIGLNERSDFWEYNPSTDSWKRLKDFPGPTRWSGVGMVINDKVYFGTGHSSSLYHQDWWEYDINNNNWIRKKDFGGGQRTEAIAFQYNQNGYVGTGQNYNDIWRYSPSDDSWNIASTYPLPDGSGISMGFATATSQNAYIGLGNVETKTPGAEKWMYNYDPINNTWTRIADFPIGLSTYMAKGFTIGNDLYVRTYYSKDYYCYTKSTNSWAKINTVPTNIEWGIAFSFGEKGYIGLGGTNAMWEYDPSR